jgi:hypothetical protein
LQRRLLVQISSRFKERWWCEEFDELRALMLEWFNELFELHTGGHYSKLRASVLAHGFQNPIIVTSGPPKRREAWMLPPDHGCQYICEQNGGSRLMLAQELDWELPCIVNGVAPGEELRGLKEVMAKFTDKTYKLQLDPVAGVMSMPMRLSHLGHFTMVQNQRAVAQTKQEIIRRADKWLEDR